MGKRDNLRQLKHNSNYFFTPYLNYSDKQEVKSVAFNNLKLYIYLFLKIQLHLFCPINSYLVIVNKIHL